MKELARRLPLVCFATYPQIATGRSQWVRACSIELLYYEVLDSRGDPSVRIDESGEPAAVEDHGPSSRGNPWVLSEEDLGSRRDLPALVDESGKPAAVTDDDPSSRG